jgi:predicted RNA methylase
MGMRKMLEKELATHFTFGENWALFSQIVTEDHVNFAQVDLERLLGIPSLREKTFCDIGCGSGIHAVAAARMGATVTALDIDPKSTKTTAAITKKFGMQQSITINNVSIFDDSLTDLRFDVVYSWGVLHHTGAMWEAIAKASELVSDDHGSMFVVALYRKTRLCRFWRIEKRLYSNARPLVQRVIKFMFSVLMDIDQARRLRSPVVVRRNYRRNRGMSRKHDLHDWLGGYPYESITHREILDFLEKRGFTLRHDLGNRQNTKRISLGLFGSGCDEYVFVRMT